MLIRKKITGKQHNTLSSLCKHGCIPRNIFTMQKYAIAFQHADFKIQNKRLEFLILTFTTVVATSNNFTTILILKIA